MKIPRAVQGRLELFRLTQRVDNKIIFQMILIIEQKVGNISNIITNISEIE